jgi:Pentapeptide repeats (8 copies)
MRSISDSLSVALLVGCLVMAVAVAGEQEGLVDPPCEGPYKGRTPTPEELETVLRHHQAWLMAGGEPNDERRADLCQAHLRRAHLQGAHLQGAHLQGADLQGADLQGADLFEAALFKARLQGVRLLGANLQGADLREADLREADLSEANLQKASLNGAKLQRANLADANLQGAGLTWAELQGAGLSGINLERAELFQANLEGALYEPNPEKLPRFWTLTDSRNHLEMLIFHASPAALIALREAFKNAGMRTEERQITYAIEHTRRLQAWQSANLWDKSESLFKLIAFELPSDYGMSPGRALKILWGSIGLFALVYMFVIVTARGHSGIWMVWLPDRVHKAEGETIPVRVTGMMFSPLKMWAAGRWRRGLARGRSVLLIGLYFSVLSAFSLGWRELNVGTWIARVQPREYTLRATGWVRTVSGIQSLLSVYLLALWVLTYFGRPFE